jgi:hypothetical protein
MGSSSAWFGRAVAKVDDFVRRVDGGLSASSDEDALERCRGAFSALRARVAVSSRVEDVCALGSALVSAGSPVLISQRLHLDEALASDEALGISMLRSVVDGSGDVCVGLARSMVDAVAPEHVDFAVAERLAVSVSLSNPAHVEALVLIALSRAELARSGRASVDEAIEAFELALAEHSACSVLLSYGSFLRTVDSVRAKEVLNRCVELCPVRFHENTPGPVLSEAHGQLALLSEGEEARLHYVKALRYVLVAELSCDG